MPKKNYQKPVVTVKKIHMDIITSSGTQTEGKDWGLGPVKP